MAKNIRNVQGINVQDPSIIDNLIYNNAAGSRKSTQVGGHYLPIPWNNSGTIAYTTDASTARILDPGTCLAIYNKDTAIHSITLGESSSVASLAPGVTDANGHVGIPCPAGQWTYVACSTQNWIITDSNNLLVFIIDDDTRLKQEAAF